MRTFKMLCLLCLVVATGCSEATVARLSTLPIDGKPLSSQPYLEKYFVSSPGGTGIVKRLWVTNPTAIPIEAVVACSSIYQADLAFRVEPHTSRIALINASHGQEHVQTCRMISDTPDYASLR